MNQLGAKRSAEWMHVARHPLAVALIMALAAGLLAATPAAGAEPKVQAERDVKGISAVALPAPEAGKSSVPVGAPDTAPRLLPGIRTVTTRTNLSPVTRGVTAAGNETTLHTTDWADVPTSLIDVARVATSHSSALKANTYNVTVLSTSERARLGNPLIALLVEQTSGQSGNIALRLPTEVLERTFGADFASRVQWKQFSSTATTGAAISESSRPVEAFEDPSSDSVVLQTRSAPATEQMVAAFGAPVSASGTGDFSATSLKPSDSWDVSAQTGAFAWSYPLRSPPAAAGPLPEVALDYNSQAVDGATGSTNNQPSSAGEGWSIGGSGFIERSYVPCASDTGPSGPVTSSGDLCWFTDNAVLSLAGHSSTLVRDQATGNWKLQNDDNSRIEHLVGTAAGCGVNGTATNDCWRLTTTDGTQYYFGLNQLPGWTAGKPTTNSTWTVPVFGNDPGEPCKSTTFAASSCNQAWRWNLDFVVDTHHNAQALYYNAETNRYSRNGTTAASYVRGGNLEHIDYGLRDSAVYAANAASDKFVFEYDARGRCSDASGQTCTNQPASGDAVAPADTAAYPDVPFDQLCTSGSCANLLSPTFWTTARLKAITTKVLKGSSYLAIDSWAFEHSYPNPGDATSAALWLTKVTHTGTSGSNTLAEPATTFTGVTMQNRVWAVDGLAPLNKYRISSITTSLGAVISVNYSSQECAPQQASAILASPQTNTKRCYPQWWSPQVTPPQPAQLDLFHKYLVTSVISDPRTGGGNDAVQQTSYVYTGTPAWRYQTSRLVPEKRRTWSVYAGYNSVEVRVGDPAAPATTAVTAYTFYQGMDGDRATSSGGTKAISVTGSPSVADSVWFAGQVRQTQTLKGVGGPVLQTVLQTPWTSAVTATDGENAARRVNIGQTMTTEPVSTGGIRSTTVSTSFDANWGFPTQVSTSRSDAGATCERTSYSAPNTTAWVLGLTAEVSTVGVSCSVTPSYPADAVSRTRTFYDNRAVGAAATIGDPTLVEIVDRYSASQPVWVTDSVTEFDTLGRPTKVTNAAGQAVSTAYTPSATAPTGSGPMTLVTTTNAAPFNWTTSVNYDPAWGAVLSRTDENGKVTSAAYDPLGRRTGVWLPGRAQSTYPSAPNTLYEYVLSQTAPNVVKTWQLGPTSTVPSVELIDGLGQIVQTQTLAVGGGLTLNDRGYDAAGRVISTYNDYWASAATGGTLFVPNNVQNIGSVTLTAFDGAARPLHTITQSYGAERFRTSYAYLAADQTDTTPPNGGTPTTEIIDSRGLKTRLVQYLAATPSATAQRLGTDYTYNARGDLTRMVDAAGTAWTWTFDVRGRRVGSSDPDSGSTTTTYDVLGNVTSTKDARNVTLSYTYDALSRKTRQNEGSPTGPLLASWSYDTLAKGQLTSTSSYAGSVAGTPGAAYTKSVGGYDDGYRPTSTTTSIPSAAPAFGGFSYTTNLFYFADGSLSSRQYPAIGGIGAERLRYSYDSLNLPGGLSGLASYGTIQYTALRQPGLIRRTGSIGLYTSRAYDPATGRLMQIKDETLANNIYTTQSDRVYTRDDAGGVTSIGTTGQVTDTQCFNYDRLQNLRDAWTALNNNCNTAPVQTNIGGAAPYWQTYNVDPATGNRTSMTSNPITAGGTAVTDTYSYPATTAARPHAVQTVSQPGSSTKSYSYDATGNATTRNDQTLTFNAIGKLDSVSTPGGTQRNIYDSAGEPLLQLDNSGATLFLGDTEARRSTGATSTAVVRRYQLSSFVLAQRVVAAGSTASALYFLGADENGTPDLQVNVTSGGLVRRFSDPFGNSRGFSGAWSSAHSFLNAPVSSQSQLVQLGARAYDPVTGRFINPDPLLSTENPQQNNGYSYAHNNPVTLSDPTGLEPRPWHDKNYKAKVTNPLPPGKTSFAAADRALAKRSSASTTRPPKDKKPVATPDTSSLCKQFNGCWGGGYKYEYYHRIGPVSEYGSAANAMRKFQAKPAAIFPFGIEGCSKFATGAECRLVNALQLPLPLDNLPASSGHVDVTVSKTSTLFTVSQEGYFDSVGSTIEFVTIESGGSLYLGQVADAEETWEPARAGVLYGGAESTWQQQADNLRRNLP